MANVWELLRADLDSLRHLKAAGTTMSPRSPRVVLDLLALPGTWPVVAHRFAHAAELRRLTFVAEFLRRLALVVFGTDIDPAARIGPGLALAHPTGVVIGPIEIGRDARLMAHVRLGGETVAGAGELDTPASDGAVIGNACWFFDGAKVVGGARVGDRAVVGTDTVVSGVVSAGAVIVGSPPRVVRWRDTEEVTA